MKTDKNGDNVKLYNLMHDLKRIDPHEFESRLKDYLKTIESSPQSEILRIDNLLFTEELQEPYNPIDMLLKSEFAGIKYITDISSKIKKKKKIGCTSCNIFI